MNERLPYLRPHKQLLLDLKLTATTQVKVILRSYPQVSLKDFQVYLDRNNGERRMKWRWTRKMHKKELLHTFEDGGDVLILS